jgi:flagellar biogenesis protein FliO
LVLIGLLAVGALILSRRHRRQGQWIRVLETTSLGPKRSLVVAQLGAEAVLLGISEAGIVLIKSGLQRAEPNEPPQLPPVPAKFEDLLAESAEDQELRRKLGAGQQARVS